MAQMHSAVKAVIQNQNRFLVISQLAGRQEFWDIPGGRIQYGESPYDALCREVKEETGLDIEILRPLGVWWFFRADDKDQVICHTFLCRAMHISIDLTKNPDSNEKIGESRWVTKAEFLSDKYPVSHQSLKDTISGIEKL